MTIDGPEFAILVGVIAVVALFIVHRHGRGRKK